MCLPFHFAGGTTLKTLGAKAEEVKAPEKTVSESMSTSDIDGKKIGAEKQNCCDFKIQFSNSLSSLINNKKDCNLHLVEFECSYVLKYALHAYLEVTTSSQIFAGTLYDAKINAKYIFSWENVEKAKISHIQSEIELKMIQCNLIIFSDKDEDGDKLNILGEKDVTPVGMCLAA